MSGTQALPPSLREGQYLHLYFEFQELGHGGKLFAKARPLLVGRNMDKRAQRQGFTSMVIRHLSICLILIFFFSLLKKYRSKSPKLLADSREGCEGRAWDHQLKDGPKSWKGERSQVARWQRWSQATNRQPWAQSDKSGGRSWVSSSDPLSLPLSPCFSASPPKLGWDC